MATSYDAIYDKLRKYASDAYHCLAVGFTYERLKRLRDNITWSEVIVGEEILFEATVLESRPDSVHFAVSAVQSVVDGDFRGIQGPSSTYDGIVKPDAPSQSALEHSD